MLKKLTAFCFIFVFYTSYIIKAQNPLVQLELAGAYSGFEIKHKWLNDSTYAIYTTLFSNCLTDTSILYNSGQVLLSNIVDSCNYYWPTPFLCNGTIVDTVNGTIVGNTVDFHSVYHPYPMVRSCSNFITQCDTPFSNSNAISYWVTKLTKIVTLPEHCGKWRCISCSDFSALAARFTITNINTANNLNRVYMATELNNLDASIHNTSSDIINSIPIYVIDGQPQSYSLAASDINGDSLVYHFIEPKRLPFSTFQYSNPVLNIPYLSPFTLAEPFSTGGTFYWDSTQAIMHFTPVGMQNPVVTLVIDEYHNGTWVGNSWHDIPIVVLPANGITVNNSPVPNSFTNATLQGNDTIYACAGKPLEYCYQLYSNTATAALDTLSGICNINTKIPNANISYQNLYTDTINACVQWLPTAVDTGWHTYTITVKDTACAGMNTVHVPHTYVYYIHVAPAIHITGSHTHCQGSTQILTASGGNGVYTWQGNNYTCLNANCDSISIAPTASSTYIASSTGVCSADTFNVNYFSDFSLSVSPVDTNICSANNILIQSSTSGSTSALQYTWLPTTNIIGSNNSSSITVLPISTIYTLTVSDSANCFVHSISSQVKYDANFHPAVSLSKNDICWGDSILLSFTNNYAITPFTFLSNVGNNLILCKPDSNIQYSIHFSSSLTTCVLDTSINIQVSKIIADAGKDKWIQQGEAVAIGSYYTMYPNNSIPTWSPASTLNSNTVPRPTATPLQTTTYYLLITNATGTCSDSDAVVVNVACPVFVANVFNPVSDNEQNKTVGPSSPYLQEVYFVVYNRWGNKVFDSKTANTTRWNGKYKGVDQSADTYFWQLKAKCPDGTDVNMKGDVVLMR